MEIGKISSSKRKGAIAWGDIRPLRRMAPNTTPKPSTPKAPPRPKSPASANPAAMAGGGSFQAPPQVSGFSDLKKLSGAALSDTEIKRRIQVEHGWTPSDADLKYARRGMGAFLRSEDPETQELLRKMRV